MLRNWCRFWRSRCFTWEGTREGTWRGFWGRNAEVEISSVHISEWPTLDSPAVLFPFQETKVKECDSVADLAIIVSTLFSKEAGRDLPQ